MRELKIIGEMWYPSSQPVLEWQCIICDEKGVKSSHHISLHDVILTGSLKSLSYFITRQRVIR